MAYLGKQPALQSNEFREEFNITSTTSTIATSGFIISGKSNYLDVYKNGVLLGSDDYTLGTDRTTITLASSAIAGDIIVVIGRRNITQGVRFSERRHEHTIANSETTVTFPYPITSDSTDVYLNGVKLAASDFSINVSTRVISFTVNPVNGDLVSIVSREPATSSSTVLPIVDSNGGSVISESNGSVVVNAGTANIGSNALVVDSNGNVGVGTSSPSQKLSVAGNAMLETNQGFLYLSNVGTNNSGIYVRGTGSTNEFRSHSTGKFTWEITGSQKMQIDSSGNIGAPSGTNIYNASDERLKQNITELSGSLQKVLSMRGVSFNWIDGFCDSEANKTLYGLIAQELQIVDSNLVDSFSNNTITAGGVTVENPLRVNEKFIIPMLVESIKEQQALIESQQEQINNLIAEVEALKAQ